MIDNGKRVVVLMGSDTDDGGWIASDFHNRPSSCRLGRRHSVLRMRPSRVGLTERGGALSGAGTRIQSTARWIPGCFKVTIPLSQRGSGRLRGAVGGVPDVI